MPDTEPLFRFDNPPVVEVILGAQFNPIPTFSNAYLGVYWRRLGADWAKVADAPALPPQYERFGSSNKWTQNVLQFQVSQDLSTRIQIRSSTDDRMIQLQNGRFIYNWLGHGGAQYPHYSLIRPEFDVKFQDLSIFLQEESLGNIILNQWEVTYVNHIPKGTLWNEPADWSRVFPFLLACPTSVSANLESLSGQWHFVIGEQLGRLHVQINHAVSSADNTELLVATLTARGSVNDKQNLDAGLDLGRKTIVNAFRKISSEPAQAFWRLIP